jgi:nitrogen fixation protein FixH
MTINESGDGARPLTGAKVLMILITFFGCIMVANFALVHYALTTFRGEEEANPYEVGIAFNQEIAAARAQDALRWNVSGVVKRVDSARVQLEIVASDAGGQALSGLFLSGKLAAPADKSNDRMIDLSEAAPGVYRGSTSAPAGAWDLIIEAKRDGVRDYRSKSRIIVQ